MEIKILGTGCPNCQKLERNTNQAVQEIGLKARIEKVSEIEKIMQYGVMSLPALIVNGEIKSYGQLPSVAEIKVMLTK